MLSAKDLCSVGYTKAENEHFREENRDRAKAAAERIVGQKKPTKDPHDKMRKEIRAGKHGPALIPEVSVRRHGVTVVIKPGTVTARSNGPFIETQDNEKSADNGQT